jgi:hypothetical protein
MERIWGGNKTDRIANHSTHLHSHCTNNPYFTLFCIPYPGVRFGIRYPYPPDSDKSDMDFKNGFGNEFGSETILFVYIPTSRTLSLPSAAPSLACHHFPLVADNSFL